MVVLLRMYALQLWNIVCDLLAHRHLQFPCSSVEILGSLGILYEMEDFWDAIKPWLRTFGIILYDLRHPEAMQPWERLPRVWYTPLAAGAPATLPYARCAQANTTKSRPCHMKVDTGCIV